MTNLYTSINIIEPMLLVASDIKQIIQPRSIEQINQISCANEGIFLLSFFLLLFISCLCIGIKYKKYKQKQAATQQEQLKILERMLEIGSL